MFNKSKQSVLNEFMVNEAIGLSSIKVVENRNIYGQNVLEKASKTTIYTLVLSQLKEVMVIILLIAAIISFLLQEHLDALVILVVIIINTTIGVFQEFKAEKAIEALEKASSFKAMVVREGVFQKIDSTSLVVGDIVILDAGCYVPCDLRLLTSINLQIEESVLTGESIASNKNADVIYDQNIPLGDQKNMAFMSTFVTYGRGSGICVRVGMQSEIGKIASLLKESKQEATPLQNRLSQLGKYLGLACVGICLLMLLIAIIQKRPFMEMLLTAISLAVAAIPEGLTAVVTIVLALGVVRMIKKRAIVRHLPSVETLGCVSVICSDKTGTLTQNKMRVVSTFANMKDNSFNKLFVHGFMLCNDVIEKEHECLGDPSEIALVEYGHFKGLKKNELILNFPRLNEIPFDSNRKMMATVHSYGKDKVVFVKGALDILLNKCTNVLIDNEVVRITSDHKAKIMAANNENTQAAQRILGLAYKKVYHEDLAKLESDLIFIGFVGMIDPPRLEVKKAIEKCKLAHIKTIMITGDHPSTALAIAKYLDIATNESQIISGNDLDNYSDDELMERLDLYRVFARVNPNHKVRLVKLYQKMGNVVAMSGDGVNDAPSLKHADIGIAMGLVGSDVAKSASDIILLDDNFATIVGAIEEGRNIYLNIQKAVLFLLSCNMGEIITLFLAILFLPSFPMPLTPIQILWVNLITDSFPSLALGVDPNEADTMKEKPRSKDESILGKGGLLYLSFNGVYIGMISLIAFRYGLTFDSRIAHTMAFMVLSISQLFHALNHRSLHSSIFKVGVFKNKYLIMTIIGGIIIQFMTTALPFFNRILKTSPLNLSLWLIVLSLSVSVILVNEIAKKVIYNE